MEDPKAEFHDIGKLIDWVAIGLHEQMQPGEPHEFERCVETQEAREKNQVDLGGAAWRAIVRKDTFAELRNKIWPQSRAWIFGSIADSLAAGYGRTINERAIQGTRPQHHYRCLWKDDSFKDDPRLTRSEDLVEMIQFLNSDPLWEEAKAKYGDLWKQRAETANPGLNVTTLLSHSETTGKLARVIAQMDWNAVDPQTPWNEIKNNTVQQAPYRIIVCHYRIDFTQKPYRVKDLGVLSALRHLMETIAKDYPDNVLSCFENELIAVFQNETIRDLFEKQILDAGFLPYKREFHNTIAKLIHDHLGTFSNHSHFPTYPELPPQRIELQICENCLMRHAEREWRSAKDELPDYLCDRCYAFREQQTPLQKLNDWNEGMALWLRVHLDIDTLTDTLNLLNRELLFPILRESKTPKEVVDKFEKEFYVAYPVVVDFLVDYDLFLKQIHEDLTASFNAKNIEHPLSNLWCLRLDSKQDVLRAIRLLHCRFQSDFPRLLREDLHSPIRFGLSLSNLKHPFFKHFSFLENLQSEIHLQVVNSGQAGMRLCHIPKILENLKVVSPSAAHRLALIAETSKALAALALKDNSEKDSDLTAVGKLIPDVLNFEDLRTLVSLSKKESKVG